jgi:trimeric autotransporter adhesin
MRSQRLLHLMTLLLALLVNSALAQNEKPVQSRESSAPAVIATFSAGHIRFASPGQILQIRLEIYNATGQLTFDSGLRAGGVIDWKVSDASQSMADGSYLCVVTVRDFHGKFGQRRGEISLRSGQLTVNRMGQQELTPEQSNSLNARRQAQKIEAAGNDDSLTVMREGKERAAVVAAHDGQEGQLTSTSGALTLGTGDFFSGNEKEQVRITPEGRVGIGTNDPQATLDVAGTIQARGGIRFEDGTVLTSAETLQRSTATGAGNAPAIVNNSAASSANLAGTGTTGNLLKWTNGGAGTAGDSVVKEQNGNIGIGTATPKNKLHVAGSIEIGTTGPKGIDPVLTNPGQVANASNLQLYPVSGTNVNMSLSIVPRGTGQAANRAQLNLFNTDFTANSTNYEFLGLRARGSDFVLGTGKAGTGAERPLMLGAGLLSDTVTNKGQLYLATNGNVGVGTITPSQKLEVAGSIKLGVAGSAIQFSDGTSLSTTTGLGQMTGGSILSAINDPNTSGTISDNRLSPNVARLNGANNWLGTHIFSLGLSANNAPVTNVGLPVNTTDAANKGYVDANFLRFNPSAPQLSVGDANGTAAMLSLRGGSTCCSGPGGHTPAFFNVFQNGSFVATGNLGIGVSPMEGKGYRTSWHTYKGAFRSGYADNEWDDANVGFFSWAGGSNSTASGLYALAFGDTNQAESTSSIVFGSGNQVKGAAGFSAGAGNRVCDTYGVALGNRAQSGGPLINGKCDPETFNIRGLAAVAIGYNVTADQDHTTAMGKFASNNGFQGTFIWSDGAAQASADTFRNTANNEFAARATGGFRFRTNLGGTTGCNLPAGSGVFNCTSSRSTKENFLMVDGEDVLSRLRVIPVSTWNYITEGKGVRHMGPMAEDFYKGFSLGTNNTSIGVQDLAGVSLAGIKALDERTMELQQKTAEVERLRTEVNELRATNTAMEQRLAALEQNASKQPQTTRKATSRRR